MNSVMEVPGWAWLERVVYEILGTLVGLTGGRTIQSQSTK